MVGTSGGVVVIASFVLDMVTHVPRRPRTGESLIGSGFGMFVGGKGCNQAIAATRAGASVRVLGRLGADVFGEQFQQVLAREGIGTRWVIVDREEGTGVAFPLIEPDGQNSIVIVPRANGRVTSDDIMAGQEAFEGAGVLLVQMEVSLEAVWKAIDLAHQRGLCVLFNPAPVPDPLPTFPAELWTQIDYLLPNEREVEALTGLPADDLSQIEHAARVLINRGCRSVVVTLGSRGALWVPGAEQPGVLLPPLKVEQVDATAAGDAFCGVLAAGLAAGQPPFSALRRASAAGALATTRLGAEPSLPTSAEIDRLLGV